MKLLLLTLAFLSTQVWANESIELIQRTHFQEPERKILCLSAEQLENPQVTNKANFLKRIGAMDENNCTNMSEDEVGFKKHIYQAALQADPFIEVAIAARPHGCYEVILTPTKPLDERASTFIELANTQKKHRSDYLKTSAIVLGSVVIGNLASDYSYGQAQDKILHARYGGAMSVAATFSATAAAFLISDSDMSPTMKKLLIGCSGFMISTLAGVTKEFLDSRDSQNHTVDAHDALATSLGGGAGIGCAYSMTF